MTLTLQSKNESIDGPHNPQNKENSFKCDSKRQSIEEALNKAIKRVPGTQLLMDSEKNDRTRRYFMRPLEAFHLF